MNSEVFVGHGEGGIPKKIFSNSRFSGIITGKSGNPLNIDISQGSISISDILPGSPCHYIASVSSGVLEFDARTQGFKGSSFNKHPDLYFSELLKESFEYFRRNNVRINSVHNEWEYNPEEDKTSDFYLEFIGMATNSSPMDAMIKAAKLTTPGKIFVGLGFNKVDKVEWHKMTKLEKIIVDFKR
jgi:hypothetical protein